MDRTVSRDILAQRLADVADVHIGDVVAGAAVLRRASPDLLQKLRQHRRAFLKETEAPAVVERLTSTLAEGLGRFLTRDYQFLLLGRHRQQRVEASYSALVEDLRQAVAPQPICTRAVAAALSRHHEQLKSVIIDALEECGGVARVAAGELPICAEYPPDLQLRILGIDVPELKGPILVLGCGSEARLLRHLRQAGRSDVFGIDLHAPSVPGAISGSWFDAPLDPGRWGTIIAHQSFSLHFWHAHLRSPVQAELYASTCMRILRALSPGGSFIYAPNLPFIESLLPADHWRVSHSHDESQPIARAAKVQRLTS